MGNSKDSPMPNAQSRRGSLIKHQVINGGVAPKFYLWGLAVGEFILCETLRERSQVSF